MKSYSYINFCCCFVAWIATAIGKISSFRSFIVDRKEPLHWLESWNHICCFKSYHNKRNPRSNNWIESKYGIISFNELKFLVFISLHKDHCWRIPLSSTKSWRSIGSSISGYVPKFRWSNHISSCNFISTRTNWIWGTQMVQWNERISDLQQIEPHNHIMKTKNIHMLGPMSCCTRSSIK